MRFIKTIFLGFPLFLYLIQTSFPAQFHLFGFTPNILLCFFVSLIFFSRSQSFIILFLSALCCLFFSSSLTILSNILFLSILCIWIALLRRYYKFDKLSLEEILAVLSISILIEVCLILFSYWQKLISIDHIIQYVIKIGLIEIFTHFLLIQLFIILGNLFLQNRHPKMIIKQ